MVRTQSGKAVILTSKIDVTGYGSKEKKNTLVLTKTEGTKKVTEYYKDGKIVAKDTGSGAESSTIYDVSKREEGSKNIRKIGDFSGGTTGITVTGVTEDTTGVHITGYTTTQQEQQITKNKIQTNEDKAKALIKSRFPYDEEQNRIDLAIQKGKETQWRTQNPDKPYRTTEPLYIEIGMPYKDITERKNIQILKKTDTGEYKETENIITPETISLMTLNEQIANKNQQEHNRYITEINNTESKNNEGSVIYKSTQFPIEILGLGKDTIKDFYSSGIDTSYKNYELISNILTYKNIKPLYNPIIMSQKENIKRTTNLGIELGTSPIYLTGGYATALIGSVGGKLAYSQPVTASEYISVGSYGLGFMFKGVETIGNTIKITNKITTPETVQLVNLGLSRDVAIARQSLKTETITLTQYTKNLLSTKVSTTMPIYTTTLGENVYSIYSTAKTLTTPYTKNIKLLSQINKYSQPILQKYQDITLGNTINKGVLYGGIYFTGKSIISEDVSLSEDVLRPVGLGIIGIKHTQYTSGLISTIGKEKIEISRIATEKQLKGEVRYGTYEALGIKPSTAENEIKIFKSSKYLLNKKEFIQARNNNLKNVWTAKPSRLGKYYVTRAGTSELTGEYSAPMLDIEFLGLQNRASGSYSFKGLSFSETPSAVRTTIKGFIKSLYKIPKKQLIQEQINILFPNENFIVKGGKYLNAQYTIITKYGSGELTIPRLKAELEGITVSGSRLLRENKYTVVPSEKVAQKKSFFERKGRIEAYSRVKNISIKDLSSFSIKNVVALARGRKAGQFLKYGIGITEGIPVAIQEREYIQISSKSLLQDIYKKRFSKKDVLDSHYNEERSYSSRYNKDIPIHVSPIYNENYNENINSYKPYKYSTSYKANSYKYDHKYKSQISKSESSTSYKYTLGYSYKYSGSSGTSGYSNKYSGSSGTSGYSNKYSGSSGYSYIPDYFITTTPSKSSSYKNSKKKKKSYNLKNFASLNVGSYSPAPIDIYPSLREVFIYEAKTGKESIKPKKTKKIKALFESQFYGLGNYETPIPVEQERKKYKI